MARHMGKLRDKKNPLTSVRQIHHNPTLASMVWTEAGVGREVADVGAWRAGGVSLVG